MNGISLFAGIGGIDLGLKWASERAGGGYRSVCYVEKEPFCQRVLQARMRDGTLDDAPIWDDVSTFDGRPWAGRVDIISGGFPCQDVSKLGTRKGLSGERSGLWWEMARTIGEVRPRYVVIENVTALYHRGLRDVQLFLSSAGYYSEAVPVSASYIGASHERSRVYVVAYADGEYAQGVAIQRQHQETLLRRKNRLRHDVWLQAPIGISRVDDGLPPGVYRSRIRALGNAVVPQMIEFLLDDLFIFDRMNYQQGRPFDSTSGAPQGRR